MSTELEAPVPAGNAPAPEAAIVVEALRKRYHRTEVLRGVSLSIARGEFATLLGPSGSGKTTILRCLAGLEDPDSGRIWMNGTLVFDAARGINITSQRRRLGMIFQNYALWPHLTVAQHIDFPLKRRGVAAAERPARVAEALRAVGLDKHGDRFPHQLSGGQQQRVAVARAIVGRPEVLLMDEPLSNLDVQLRRQLRGELLEAHRHSGATSVFVTHDQSEAFALSDRLFVMRDGEICQQGPTDEVRDRPASEFVARFIGYENFLSGRDLQALFPDAPPGRFGGDRTHAIASTALHGEPPPAGGALRTIEGRIVGSVYDGLVHALRLSFGSVELEMKTLRPPANTGGAIQVWVSEGDILVIG